MVKGGTVEFGDQNKIFASAFTTFNESTALPAQPMRSAASIRHPYQGLSAGPGLSAGLGLSAGPGLAEPLALAGSGISASNLHTGTRANAIIPLTKRLARLPVGSGIDLLNAAVDSLPAAAQGLASLIDPINRFASDPTNLRLADHGFHSSMGNGLSLWVPALFDPAVLGLIGSSFIPETAAALFQNLVR